MQKKIGNFQSEFALIYMQSQKETHLPTFIFFQGRTVKFRGCKLGDDGKKQKLLVCVIRLEESCTFGSCCEITLLCFSKEVPVVT